jgi:O-antigen ligase
MLGSSVEHKIILKPGNTTASGNKSVAILGVVILSVSIVLAYIMLHAGISSFFLILAGIAALPIVYTIVAYPKTGILLLIVMGYAIMFLGRLNIPFPLGTLMDVIVTLLVFSFFLKQKFEKDWSFIKTPISGVVLAWIAYNLIEAINPWAESRAAWLYAVRPIALVAVTYFIFHFFIRDIKFIRTILKLWIGMSIIVALYGLKQEYFGFAEFEKTWIASDPKIEGLYFIGGHWRKFSIFSDPVTFAYNMVISSIICFCLMTGPLATWKKVTLMLLGCLFFFSMLYSGTRGAYVLYPAAFLLYAILKYNRKVMMGGVILCMVGVFFIMVPTSNYTLYRFQTAFKPNKDPSYILRKNNQKKIQPYILSHPLGGGIGSTGVWGKRFSPYSYLANFPPDSGYVRVAVEMGWVGLLLFCTFMFVVLKNGIRNYFIIKNPELKSYCLAMVMILFALHIGNYPQEALVQYPINIYFYLAIALLGVTLKLHKEEEEKILKQSENN